MRVLLLAISLGLIGALSFQGSTAQQATINVTTLADVVADDGQCSLREALVNAADQAATHGDCAAGNLFNTIVLPAGTITLSGTALYVTGAVSIKGQGMDDSVVSADSLSGVFHVESGGSVAFEDLEIRDGLAERGAGIDHVLGELTLTRVRLSMNEATDLGGGLASTGAASLVAILDSELLANEAPTGGGAAVDAEQGPRTVSIVDSYFADNAATGSGGGYWQRSGTLLVFDSVFSVNTANSYAGLSLWGVDAEITGTIIDANVATNSGGGIGVFSGTSLTLVDVEVIQNVATDGGGLAIPAEGPLSTVRIFDSLLRSHEIPGSGGAIFMQRGTLEVERSRILLNRADTGGSGIWVWLDTDDVADVTIRLSRFFTNTSIATGGALFFEGTAGTGTLLIDSSSFNNNNTNGASVVLNGIEGEIVNSTFTSSTNTTIRVTAPPANVIITNSTLVADYPGNVVSNVLIHALHDSSVTLQNTVLVLARQQACIEENGGTIGGFSNANDDGTCPGAINVSGYDVLQPPVFTHDLLIHRPFPGSAIVGAGSAGLCPALDQLGVSRGDGPCTIGAIEDAFRLVLPGSARD